MKHIFIINPIAGLGNSYDRICNELSTFKDKYDIIIHETTCSKNATSFVKDYLQNNPEEIVRFYACGGDGTLNEVCNGIVGYENASVSIYPCGSGDDFVKCIGGASLYKDISKLLECPNKKIDILKVNGYYCINVCNFGFDAKVASIANSVKGKTKHPYSVGLRRSLLKHRKNEITVVADGKILNESGKILLCTLANGSHNGGKYNCAPYYKIDDGLIEVCLIKPASIIRFLTMVPFYTKGTHIKSKWCRKYITFTKAKHIEMFADKEFEVCLDGEMINGNKFSVDVISNNINFGIIDK